MARIRTIKPEFWQDEELSTVSESACLMAIGLLNYADDEGYFNANPGLIKSVVFPLRETDSSIPVLLQELSEIGYLRLGKSPDGRKTYGLINNFADNQVINKKKDSKIKALEILWDEYGTDTGQVPGERKGKEGKGKDSILEPVAPVYLSAKKRTLKGDLLDWFNQVWDAFDYKNGKADAADAFLDSVKFHGRPNYPLQTILLAAKAEAQRRKTLRDDQTPIMLQGWLNKRRYEDYRPPKKTEPSEADWQRAELYANSTGTLPADMKLDDCPEHLRESIERHLQ